MRKYFLGLSTFLILSMNAASAYDGIIIVLEAPLLKSPSMKSTVLQVIRKGEKVYVPREYANPADMPEFIPTFDRAGNRAYVPSRYVKVVTGTTAESHQSIRYAGNDPTDYRLEEPIPKTYPFEDRNFLRASASFIVGNNTTAAYGYNSPFNSQEFRADMGGRIAITRKVAFDKYDRFYFGFIGLITTAKNTTKFKNDALAEESRSVMRGGPWLTYDAFKNEKLRLSIGTGFTFNYHRSSLLVDKAPQSEERLFSGFSISPMTNTTLQINDVLPNTDFVTGVDLSLFLPYSVKSNEEAEIPELWGENNQISSGLKAQASLFLGIQVKY